MYVVDLLQRFQSVHGFVGANLQGLVNRAIFTAGIAYNNAKYQRQTNDVDYKDLGLYSVADYSFAEMELKYEDQNLKFSFGSLLQDTDGILAPPPLVKFSRSKNMGITVIDEGDDESEIVEFSSLKSWDIDIRGILIDMNEHHYPQSKVREIVRFFEINDVINVISPLFQDMGINSLYFCDQTIEPVEAFPDTVRFTINAKSIKPAEFTILNG